MQYSKYVEWMLRCLQFVQSRSAELFVVVTVFVVGDVPKGDWRSASANDRIFVYNNRFNQFNTVLANNIRTLYKRN